MDNDNNEIIEKIDNNNEAEKQNINNNNNIKNKIQEISEEFLSSSIISNIQKKIFNNTKKASNDFCPDSTKLVAFVGPAKSGTSFIVNNLALLYSKCGIRTAVLDVTRNKNSYYIFNGNDNELRKIACSCYKNLREGIDDGIYINDNLTIFTDLPGTENQFEDYEVIIKTLKKHYSIVLLDCDFETNEGYFENAQEIYMIQTMDFLTIPPFTEFLRNLKNQGLLNQKKFNVIINKVEDINRDSTDDIVSKLSCYNSLSGSVMSELFNKDTIKKYIIPFNIDAYSEYLEMVLECEIKLDNYPTEFIERLNMLAKAIYPSVEISDN